MSEKYNKVLIIPGGSGMAIAAIQMLNQTDNITTIAADVDPLAPGLYLAKKGYIVPPFKDKQFLKKIMNIIESDNVDVIIPALDNILLEFSKQKNEFEKIGCKVLISNVETIQITRDKWKTYNFLKNKIQLPKSFIYLSDITTDFPLFIKPRDGSGSINAYKVENEYELEFYFRKIKKPIIQEYLGGREYTVDCLTDMNGDLLFSIIRERLETKAGISIKGKIVKNKKLEDMAKTISENLSFKGPFFFQAKEDSNREPKLTEINARISGTMSLSSASGVNIYILSLKILMGEKFDIPKINNNLYITRYWNDLFLSNMDIKN